MGDEILFSSVEDSNLKKIEEILIEKIRDQISNRYGVITGKISQEPDYILEYINKIYINNDPAEIINNFEQYVSDSGYEQEYDFICTNLLKLFSEYIGIKLDIDREMSSFSDIYDIYVVFVLSFKQTVELSYRGYLSLNGGDYNQKITLDSLSKYIMSDEFSSNDDFIKNASFGSENDLILNIKNNIDSFLFIIDHNIFIKYVCDFIVGNEF